MYNVRMKNSPENTPRDNHASCTVAFVPKGRFRFALSLILMMILLLSCTVVAKDLTCSHLPNLMEAFHANHYAMKSTTAEIRIHAVDQMIKRLDPSKTLLYESDLKKLKELLLDLFVSAEKGNCTSLISVYDLLVVRVRENEAIVKKILGPDFRLDMMAELNINVDKRPYPKTTAEKQGILKKIVQFQIENSLLSGIDLATAKKKQIHRYELQTMRVVEQNPAQLIATAAEAFAESLDPHTSYLTPKNLEDLQISMKLSLEGIGALLSSDTGFTIIEELVPGGGAEKTGLLNPKDKIIAVAQEGEKPVDVIDMDLRDVISMIRGKKGTRVTLTILRQAQRKERFNVTIMRDKIDVKEQEAKITYEIRKVNGRQYRFGVIDLPSFYGGEKGGKSSYEDVKRLLAGARRQQVDGIVLNLSRNGGGLLEEAGERRRQAQHQCGPRGGSTGTLHGPPCHSDEQNECLGKRNSCGCITRLPSRGDRRVGPYLRQGFRAVTNATAFGARRNEGHNGVVLPARRQINAEDRCGGGCQVAWLVCTRRYR
jgi:carboxyl-terminal processing protease